MSAHDPNEKRPPAPEDTPAQAPAAAPEPPRRGGPDRFQDGASQRKPAFVMKPERNDPGSAIPRSRVLDPRLIPVVPPSVTTDPARQFHALLGLPKAPVAKPLPPEIPPPPTKPAPRPRPEPKARAKPPPKPAAPPPAAPEPPQGPPEIEKILRTLPPARAHIIRQVITGPESRLKRALRAYIEDQRFKSLDFEAQRRALAAFDLRY
ncbi:MAG TPA: hypothetical protein VGK67_21040 [Myxococcales bacterium]|jgi:hypothetical protein